MLLISSFVTVIDFVVASVFLVFALWLEEAPVEVVFLCEYLVNKGDDVVMTTFVVLRDVIGLTFVDFDLVVVVVFAGVVVVEAGDELFGVGGRVVGTIRVRDQFIAMRKL